ncbi:MAG: penicillin-binding transpeptidase domain-containing protein [Slackia sp.]
MTRRNTELLLLCLAAPFVILLFSMVLVKQDTALSFETLAVPLGLFGAFIVAHIATRFFAKNADPAIMPIVFGLSGIGIAFVTRLAPDLAIRQVMWLFLGIVLMVATLAIVRNLDKLARYKYTFTIVGIVPLLMPMLPGIGQEVLGSRIWIKIGSASSRAKSPRCASSSSSIPSGAKPRDAFGIHRARRPLLPARRRNAGPLLVMWGISFSIAVFEKDLGSALVCFVPSSLCSTSQAARRCSSSWALPGGPRLRHPLCSVWPHLNSREHLARPFSDAMNTGYQLCQSIYSLADGGMLGVGVGNGLAENIPVVESDFIFAAIAEETGLWAVRPCCCCSCALAIRGFATAARAKSDVSSFVAVGVTVTIVLQAFIIVGGVTRLIPLTGLTLPFISQGGSSLLASFIGIGLLLRCGDEGTGINSEMKDGTGRMRAIGAHGTTRGANDSSVLGRVALGRRLTSTMVAFALLFALLVANLTYVMVFMADEYQSYPGNNHTLYREAKTERGSISTYDGVVLAESVQQEDGTYVRTYPQGSLASHVVGYYSQQYGLSGIEQSMNDTLKGQENFASWSDVVNYLAGINTPGNDVALTLNSKIQQAAEEVLEGYKGAVVVMDPNTGAVLALASSPTYSNADVESLLAAASSGSDSSGGALINRATNALYAPGSTFKLVTLTALLENGLATESTQVESPAFATIGNGELSNANDIGYGTITLKRATEVSSNTAFGALGAEKVGSNLLVETAEKFGFNKAIDDFELPLYTSLMPDPEEMTEWETAWAACGQPVGQHESPAGPQATVMQMAMVASAIANDGVLETPYFVEGVYNSKGERSFTASAKAYGTVMSKQTADSITDMMIGVVENGTGYEAAISGVEVAGKTGTAETNKEYNDSWFVGFAPADNPSVVVAVAIEEGVHGNDEAGLASPRAKKVLETALQVQGLL